MLDLLSVKNIIFDLGGVILNIDYHLTETKFTELGIEDFRHIYSQAKQNLIFDDLETGKLSADEFRSYIKTIKPSLLNADIDDAWNAMLLDLPLKRVTLLRELQKKYRLFLLSNTNEIHIKAFQQIISATYSNSLFDSVFEKQYYSSEIGLRKPNADCFNLVLEENGLVPSETLFIDDSVQHIKGADGLGINTYHLQPDEDIATLFPDIVQ